MSSSCSGWRGSEIRPASHQVYSEENIYPMGFIALHGVVVNAFFIHEACVNIHLELFEKLLKSDPLPIEGKHKLLNPPRFGYFFCFGKKDSGHMRVFC